MYIHNVCMHVFILCIAIAIAFAMGSGKKGNSGPQNKLGRQELLAQVRAFPQFFSSPSLTKHPKIYGITIRKP